MPFVWDNEVAKDVRVGEKQIKRIYSGKDLVWGVFNLDYISTINSKGYASDQFVWGTGKSTVKPVVNWDGNKDYIYSVFGGYRDSLNVTGDLKWYTDNNCTKPLNLTTCIPRTTKKDVTLYSKWKITSKIYKMVYSQQEYIQGTNSVSVDGDYPTDNKTTTDEWKETHPNYYRWDAGDLIGECTWYANGRTAQMHGGEGAPHGDGSWGHANTWVNDADGNWHGSTNHSEAKVGDVYVCDNSDHGHVGVIESISNGKFYISHWNNSHKSFKPASVVPGDPLGGSAWIGYCIYGGSSNVHSGSSDINSDEGTSGYWTTNYMSTDEWKFSKDFDDWDDVDGWEKDHLEEKTVYKIVTGINSSEWIG